MKRARQIVEDLKTMGALVKIEELCPQRGYLLPLRHDGRAHCERAMVRIHETLGRARN